MKIAKGIILAGGTGSRLYPLTIASNKQLLPIYDKPAVYYPLTTLMLAGIKEVLIISTPKDITALESLFGDGTAFGMTFSYKVQAEPRGLPEAFILGEEFIEQKPVAMILGDNFFHGHGLAQVIGEASDNLNGAHIFAYPVDDPSRYGVVTFDKNQKVASLEEKPAKPRSNYAVTGLYFFDGHVSEYAKQLKFSQRGETEITDLLKYYLSLKKLDVSVLGRGYVWFDVGTSKSLLDASNYVEVIQSRQGTIIASPEEVAWRMGFIEKEDFLSHVYSLPKSQYQQYLLRIDSL